MGVVYPHGTCKLFGKFDSYPTWYCLFKVPYNFKGPLGFVTFNNITKSVLIPLIHLGIYRNYQ